MKVVQTRMETSSGCNVALTTDNIDNLQHEAHRIQRRLAERPTLPPLLELQLHARQRDINEFVAQRTHRDGR
jgi:hypothetical protein